jgi:hypothetical protein
LGAEDKAFDCGYELERLLIQAGACIELIDDGLQQDIGMARGECNVVCQFSNRS